MMTLEEIRKSLQDRRLSIVSKATGLHYNTLRNIRDGKSSHVRHSTVEILSKYLKGES